MDPLDILMEEHRVFERLLEGLEQCLDAGDTVPVVEVAAFAEVFASFDQLLHQAKEEGLLIPALRLHGLPEQGLLSAVHSEHADERELVRQLAEAAAAGDQGRIVEIACAYADHARCHVFTEETIVFPLARERLTPPQLAELSEAFTRFGQDSEAACRALLDRAEELSNRYASKPACIQPRGSWSGTDD